MASDSRSPGALRPAAQAQRRFPIWLVVAVLASCGTFVSLQQTMIIPMIGDLPALFHTAPANTSWLITATLLTSAVAMPSVSRLADMYGKRRMLVLCVVMITAGSLIGALGTNLALVILARALQGFSTAMIPVGISIMRDELPEERVAAAVALMSATLGIGGAIGLPLGGVLYAQFGYHSLFWVSAAAGLVMFAGIVIVVNESQIRTPGRFDVVGAALISVALLALLLAITKGSAWGWGSAQTLGLIGGFVVLLAIWVPLELRSRSPLIDLRTSARRPVLLTNIATILIGFAMFAQMLGVTQLLTVPTSSGYGFGLSPVEAGLTMLPGGLMMAVLAPVSAGITDRFGAKTTLLTGAALMSAGYFVLTQALGTVLSIVVVAAFIGSGLALGYAAMPTLIMRAVPVTETASANGLNALLRSMGTSSSSATTAALLSGITITAGGVVLPSLVAFKTLFLISGASALCGLIVALFLPKHRADLEPSFDPGAEYDSGAVAHARAEHGEGVDVGRRGKATCRS